MKDLESALRIIRSSKCYEFVDTTTLRITGYFTGDSLYLDLSNITEDILEALQVPSPSDSEESEESEDDR